MKVRRDYNTDEYTVTLSESEAMEFHEFISSRARHKRDDNNPQLEMEIANELFNCGLIELYEDQWRREYG